jgi:hypothetical protein
VLLLLLTCSPRPFSEANTRIAFLWRCLAQMARQARHVNVSDSSLESRSARLAEMWTKSGLNSKINFS